MKVSKSLTVMSELFRRISLHIDDVELLQNAYVVQSLVCPLVRFSNRGRFEPYAAKSWRRDDSTWTFELRTGLNDEAGAAIDAEAFKHALERSMRRLTSDDLEQTPFAALKQMDAAGQRLELTFKSPVGWILLEYLAMTPFAYVSAANFEGDEWISRDTFRSSGPYRIESYDPESSNVKLLSRPEWPLTPVEAPEVVLFGATPPKTSKTSRLFMTYETARLTSEPKSTVNEVPRALLSIRLGSDRGFFALKTNRQILRGKLDELVKQTPIPYANCYRAETMFHGQITGHEPMAMVHEPVQIPEHPLRIKVRRGDRSAEHEQRLVCDALDRLAWPYVLMPTGGASAASYHDRDYDVAFDRSHVDATVDPEIVRLLFRSNLGPRYQDPGTRVGKLIDDFDSGTSTYRDFIIGFNVAIADEAAIIPLYHRGLVWCFSKDVAVADISPYASIIRFDELKMTASR